MISNFDKPVITRKSYVRDRSRYNFNWPQGCIVNDMCQILPFYDIGARYSDITQPYQVQNPRMHFWTHTSILDPLTGLINCKTPKQTVISQPFTNSETEVAKDQQETPEKSRIYETWDSQKLRRMNESNMFTRNRDQASSSDAMMRPPHKNFKHLPPRVRSQSQSQSLNTNSARQEPPNPPLFNRHVSSRSTPSRQSFQPILKISHLPNIVASESASKARSRPLPTKVQSLGPGSTKN